MKHLDPDLIASLADGAAPSGDASAHLRACAQCRDELAELKALTQDLRRAPQPPKHLQQATLQRLGLRACKSGGWVLPRWAWAPALAALALAWWLPQQQAPAPIQSISQAQTQALAQAPAPAKAKAPAPAAAPVLAAAPTAIQAPVQPSVEAPAAVGAAPEAAPQAAAPLLHSAPKETPTPVAGFTVQVRNNLIKPGQSLALSVELPAAGSFLARVYDGRGRSVETLYEGVAGPGALILHWDAAGAPSGTYIVLLKSGAHSKKVQVLVAH